MKNKTRVNHRYPLLWLVAGAILIAACGDVTGFHARMFETGADTVADNGTDNDAPEFTLVLDVSELDSRDSVSFSASGELLQTTGFSGRTVRIYYTLANPEDMRVSELYLTFQTRDETIRPADRSPFPYTVNPDDADEYGLIRIFAASVHTNQIPLNQPTNVTLTQSGEITFTAGANNEGAGANFTYTLYRDMTPVPGFTDRPIVSGAIFPTLPTEMLSEARVYTVRVTARTVNPAYVASSLASAHSAPVHVHAVTVEITGNDVDMVTVNGVYHTETFTVRVFRGSTVTLTATVVGQRYVTWDGGGETDEEADPAVRVVTNISANVNVTAVFADPATPVITITTQPAATTSVVFGDISGSLNVAASVTGGGTVSFQWFSNTSASNEHGSPVIPSATSASFDIPTDLAVGTHYFFAEATADGATPVRTTVAIVTVIPPLVEMVRVEGGSFERGRELGTAGEGDTTPVFPITISAFYLGRYQVTREQWTAVMTGNPNGILYTNPSWNNALPNCMEDAAGFNVNRRPVTNVSWYDAIVFSNRMSIQRGLTPAYEMRTEADANEWSTDPYTWGSAPTSWDDRWNNVRVVPGSTGYRLPTEAQWEFAAKGGNAPGPYTFAGSNTATAVGWINTNSENSPRMVGLLPANSLGLRDMTGNVWEWVWDWFGTYIDEQLPDPVGAPSGSNRVDRGGGWTSNANIARSVFRGNGADPNSRWSNYGFRVARP